MERGDFGAPGGRSRRREAGMSGETGTGKKGREDMTTLRSGKKKDINSAIPSSLFLSLQPRSLRLICVKSRRNSSTGFFPRGSESHRARGGASNAWRPAHVCTYQRLHTWREQIIPISLACTRSALRVRDTHARMHARTRAFSRRLVASGANRRTPSIRRRKFDWYEGGERFLSEEEKDKGV